MTRPAAENDALRRGLEDLIEHHWLNLANSTDRYLAANYGLAVPVEALRDLLDETRVIPPEATQP